MAAWSSTGRASRSGTSRSAGGDTTPRRWTHICGRSRSRSRSCAARWSTAPESRWLDRRHPGAGHPRGRRGDRCGHRAESLGGRAPDACEADSDAERTRAERWARPSARGRGRPGHGRPDRARRVDGRRGRRARGEPARRRRQARYRPHDGGDGDERAVRRRRGPRAAPSGIPAEDPIHQDDASTRTPCHQGLPDGGASQAGIFRVRPHGAAAPAAPPRQRLATCAAPTPSPPRRPIRRAGGGGNGDLDGARLIALNMALNGESRADTDATWPSTTSSPTGRS